MKKTLLLLLFLLIGTISVTAVERELPVKAGLLDLTGGARTGENEHPEFMALRRIMKIQGIPFEQLGEDQDLSRYRLIFTAGALTNSSLSPEMVYALYDYVELGGTLVSAGQIGNKLFSLFGITDHIPSQRRYRLMFTGNDPSLRYLDRPEEITISLGNGEFHIYDDVIWSHGYKGPGKESSLGVYPDGSTGFLVHRYGRGQTYLIGISYSDSVLLPQESGDYEAQRRYVNSLEPSADVIMLILKAIYQKVHPVTAVLSAIPQSRPTALLLSHDVDAQTAFVDSLKFAALEAEFGVSSTFFINTKTFTNEMDIDYYNIEENRDAVRELWKMNWDIGSHTVTHYADFSHSPEGSPDVTIESYRPWNKITIHGEVKVSKQLLDRDVPGLDTISFRAGNLEFPPILIRVLEESGYQYDSTFSANDALTAFPYFALKERNLGSRESSVVEMPVTLDDALGFLTPDTVDAAVNTWIDVTNAHRDNGAITVLLLHPSDTRNQDFKLRAQRRLMEHVRNIDGWMGNMTEFGMFWRQREETEFRLYRDQAGRLIIRLNKSSADLHPWIGFEVRGRIPETVIVQDSSGRALDCKHRWNDETLHLGLKGAEAKGRYP